MKNILITLLILLMAVPAFAAGIGYIDYNKVAENFYYAKTTTRELDEKAKVIDAFIAKKEEEFQTIESPVQRKKFEEDVRAEITKREVAFDNFKSKREETVNSKIREGIEQIRLEKNLDAVISADSVYSGGIDITDEVIEFLNK